MAVEDLYTERVAIDPDNATLITDAPVQVYLPNDLSRVNPLRVYEPASGVEITDLRSNRIGIVQQVRVEGDPAEVVFKSGPYEIKAQSKFGVLYEFGLTPENISAALAAPEAAAEAGAAQAAIAAGHAATASAAVAEATTAAAQATASKEDAVAAAASVQRDQPNGVAPLGSDGKLPEPKLPTRLSEAGLSATIGDLIAEDTTMDARAQQAVEEATAGAGFLTGSNLSLATDAWGRSYLIFVPASAPVAPGSYTSAYSATY